MICTELILLRLPVIVSIPYASNFSSLPLASRSEHSYSITDMSFVTPPRVVTFSSSIFPLKQQRSANLIDTKFEVHPRSQKTFAFICRQTKRTCMISNITSPSFLFSTEPATVKTLASLQKSSCTLCDFEQPRSSFVPPHTRSFLRQSSDLWSPTQ